MNLQQGTPPAAAARSKSVDIATTQQIIRDGILARQLHKYNV